MWGGLEILYGYTLQPRRIPNPHQDAIPPHKIQPVSLFSNHPAPAEQCDEPDHEKDDKQNLRNTGSCSSDSGETQNRCNNRDNQKYKRPMKHVCSPVGDTFYGTRTYKEHMLCQGMIACQCAELA